MCKVEPLQAGNKIKSWSEIIKVTKSPIQWGTVNLQVRIKIPLILYKRLYKDDWAIDKNQGNSIIFTSSDFWNLTKFDLNLSQKASKEDGFLQRYLSL